MKVFVEEFLIFVWKQAQASLFGGLLLAFIILSTALDLPGLHQYDYIFIYAIAIQMLLVICGLETRKEVAAIFVFHIVATIMELYKTSDAVNSWHYPGAAVIALGQVPLFAGFMYSAVGSYIARAWKLLEQRYTHYPSLLYTYLLSIGIYINFFTHHYIIDLRYILITITFVLFWKTRVYYTLKREHSMPLLVGFALVSFFIWIAENIATYANIWLYPNQEMSWALVSPQKMGSWFLLMIISFVLVSLLYKKTLHRN